MTVSVVEPCQERVAVLEREAEALTPVPVDQLITSLSETPVSLNSRAWQGCGLKLDETHPLTPLHSHTWFSTENYWRVMKWCGAALEASRSATQSPAAMDLVKFLVAAMLDRYHNDRALFAASRLPNNPAPQRLTDIPTSVVRRNVRYDRRDGPLAWSLDVPLEAVDRAAALTGLAEPDKLIKMKYEERTNAYDPLIYAQYGDWAVKIAEWV